MSEPVNSQDVLDTPVIPLAARIISEMRKATKNDTDDMALAKLEAVINSNAEPTYRDLAVAREELINELVTRRAESDKRKSGVIVAGDDTSRPLRDDRFDEIMQSISDLTKKAIEAAAVRQQIGHQIRTALHKRSGEQLPALPPPRNS